MSSSKPLKICPVPEPEPTPASTLMPSTSTALCVNPKFGNFEIPALPTLALNASQEEILNFWIKHFQTVNFYNAMLFQCRNPPGVEGSTENEKIKRKPLARTEDHEMTVTRSIFESIQLIITHKSAPRSFDSYFDLSGPFGTVNLCHSTTKNPSYSINVADNFVYTQDLKFQLSAFNYEEIPPLITYVGNGYRIKLQLIDIDDDTFDLVSEYYGPKSQPRVIITFKRKCKPIYLHFILQKLCVPNDVNVYLYGDNDRPETHLVIVDIPTRVALTDEPGCPPAHYTFANTTTDITQSSKKKSGNENESAQTTNLVGKTT